MGLLGTPIGNMLYLLGVGPDAAAARRSKQVDAALGGDGDPAHNYLNDPQGAIQRVMQIDAPTGIKMQSDYQTQQANNAKNRLANSKETTGLMAQYLRGLDPQKDDVGKAIDSLSPYFKTLGIGDDQVSAFKSAALANPDILRGLDDKAFEQMSKDQYTSTVATPGSHVLRGGKVIDEVPYAAKPVSTSPGSVTNVFDPNTKSFVTPNTAASSSGAPAASPAALTVDTLRPHFLAQESRGDYTAVQKGTGALGAYQVMPDTGRKLAQRLGLAWRPDMMHKDDPASKRYQDAIGGAAIQDSIDAGQGDPARVFSHYYSGSPTAYLDAKGNPKTAAYTQRMLGRINGGAGGAGPTVSSTSVINPPKPTKAPNTSRTLSPAEAKAAGYPDGAVVQRDANGKETVTYKPGKAPDHEAALNTYNEAKASIGDIRQNLIALRDDPSLEHNTGAYAWALRHVPGTHAKYLQGLADQINAQKLVGLATALKATGGNPFQRITNMEAQQLPKTLGNFDLSQNPADLRKNINSALAQLDRLEGRLDKGANRTGLLSGDEGAPAQAATSSISVGAVARDAQGNRMRFKGGDSSDPANWEKF